MKKKNVVVVISGGMDSTALLFHHVLVRGDNVRAISFDYGQRHHRELFFATKTCASLSVPHGIVNLSKLAGFLPGSSQTDPSIAVPEGRYDEESMKLTVVPNRNMIMLAVAIGHAIAYKMDYVSYGAHAGDHTIYPDCRPAFAKAMNKAAGLCDWRKIKLLRPFIKKTKADIVKFCHTHSLSLSGTFSCYKGHEVHCGRCGTCIERREAFYLAQVPDPTVYDENAPSVEALVAKSWKL